MRDRNLSGQLTLALASSHDGCNPSSEVVEGYEERYSERSGLLERCQFRLSCHGWRLLVIRGEGTLVCAYHQSNVSVRSHSTACTSPPVASWCHSPSHPSAPNCLDRPRLLAAVWFVRPRK